MGQNHWQSHTPRLCPNRLGNYFLKNETANSIEVWKDNLIFILIEDTRFANFLQPDIKWTKKSKAKPKRGLTDDDYSVSEGSRLTVAQKVVILEHMLGQIANYCPINSRSTIVKNSTSLEYIRQAIRLHFGLQHTGAQFLDFAKICQEPGEKPEDLYWRLVAFADDNLLTQGSVIRHHGESQTRDGDITPTVENFIVLTWLHLIHLELPLQVKQCYGPDLRSRMLATIKPEISQALPALIDELLTSKDEHVLHTAASQFRPSCLFSSNRTYHKPKDKSTHECPLCQQTKRPRTDHFPSTCLSCQTGTKNTCYMLDLSPA